MKRKLFFLLCALLLGLSNASADVILETDLTSQFNSLATTQWTLSSGQVGWAAPQVTTNSGLTVAAWERYVTDCNWTGDIMYSSVTGLAPGTYKIELYGAAAFTFGRGFGSTAFTGDFNKDVSDTYTENQSITENTGVTLYAQTSEGTVSNEIPIWYAVNFNTSGIATATLNNVVVGDNGTIKIGLSKTSTSTNWHVVQLKGVTATVSGDAVIAALKSTAYALLNNATYTNVSGSERTNLQAAYNATPAAQTQDAYQTVISNLNDAISVFESCDYAAYDRFATEKAKASDLGMDVSGYSATDASDAATKVNTIKVDEYTFVTTNYPYGVALGDWTSTGTNTEAATFNNEHWSGETHDYMNQKDGTGQGWQAASWSIDFSQDVTLPAGSYVFKVAGRQAGGSIVTSLVVKQGETTLGTVSDFPRSNNSRGINKSGATAFEGETSDFANNGNGFGWEWRYVKFTLNDNAVVNIAVNSVASEIHQWVSFGDYTLQTDNEATNALVAYNIALSAAITVRDDATYANVGGTDRSNLVAAINADASLDKTSRVDVEAATSTLNTTRATFTAGVSSWNAYVPAKSYADAISDVVLPYAASAKIADVVTARSATVNTASDAATAATSINTANRAAYESNAIAENVSGVSRTNLIKNAYGSATDGWSGEFWTMTNEPYTQANGTTATSYFDKNGEKSFTTSQTIKLPKGNYILSVTARAQSGIDSYKMQVTNNADEIEEVSLTAMGNQNGVFGRGWNDAFVVFEQKAFGDATISVVGDNTTDANFWMSWGRFRLYSIGGEEAYVISEDETYTPVSGDVAGIEVSLTRTIKSDVINTLVLPFDMSQSEVETAFGTGSKVYVVDRYDAENEKVVFSQDENGITANKPCLLKATSARTDYTFTGRTLKAGTATDTGENISMTGNYANPFTVPENNYIISGGSIYLVNSTVAMKTMRAYITLTNSSSARVSIAFDDDDPTAINAIEAAEEDGVQKDGKFLEDGKIVIVKNGVKYSANGQILK